MWRIIYGYGFMTTLYILARLTVDWWLIRAADNLIPWLAGIAALFAILALLSARRGVLIIMQLPILVLFAGLYGEYFRSSPPPVIPADALSMTIATYNLRSVDADGEQIIPVIQALNADVIGVQELGAGMAEMLQNQLITYPHQALYPRESDFGLGVISRYPILEHKPLTFYENYRGDIKLVLMRAVIDVEGQPVTIFVAHPPVPFLTEAADHADQISRLQNLIQAETNPVLVLCDCNMTDQSSGYGLLDRELQDSFQKVGSGLGFSYAPQFFNLPAILPLLWRIDYIWHSPEFIAVEASVYPENGTSDHHPLVAQLALRRRQR